MPNFRRILIFQTAYLGDVVLTTPLLAALKAKFPGSSIDIVVQPQWKPLVEHHPAVSGVVTFDKRGKDSGLVGTVKFARFVETRKYDVVLCPHPSFRSGLILRLAKIPMRIGFRDSSGAFFFTKALTRNKNLHEVERVLSLLQAFGGAPLEPPPTRVYLPKDITAREILARFGIEPGERLAGMHPGSVWATKQWLPERFGELGARLSERFDKVLVFGGPGEKSIAGEVARLAGSKAVDLSGSLSLIELAAVISELSLFVTNDSGPMHIAAAFERPVVAIFGSTVPRFGYTPFGTASRIVETELPCRPCGPHGRRKCPEGHFRCMRDLTVEAVYKACMELLNEGSIA